MEALVTLSIQPLIDAYLRALEPWRSHSHGIYLSGSIAMGASEELASDIDLLALMQSQWSSLELKQLQTLHTHLIKADLRGPASRGVLLAPALSWSLASGAKKERSLPIQPCMMARFPLTHMLA